MLNNKNNDILKILQEVCGEVIKSSRISNGLLVVDLLAEDIYFVVSLIKRDERLDFPLLVDISGVDYLEHKDGSILERFGVIYIFYSFVNDLRIKIRAFVSESNPEIHSIYNEYKGANWTEREVYDMFGIIFKGHPDLKRILMPENYGSHPLRKEYPVKGLGERSNFPKYNIYEKLKKD
ncbi:MAG: NADH-quinone oxidoreductase subunit C [Spirochaetota bacterium]|nr:NADH-quinone oxidoreductase subunit C [Spirochaetota bacterium]